MIDCSECESTDAVMRVYGNTIMIALCDECAGELEREIEVDNAGQ